MFRKINKTAPAAINRNKGKTMFEDQFKKYEDLVERTKQAYEFWYNCLYSSVKEFFNTKTK